jgi:rubrerythrin
VYDAYYTFDPYYGPQVYTEDLKENVSGEVIYSVKSDLDDKIFYAEFKTKDAAIEYAKRNLDKLPVVNEVRVFRDDSGEIDDAFGDEPVWDHAKTIWDHTMADGAKEETEDDYWDDLANMYDDSEKHVIGDTTWFESVDAAELVETLEENEDTVECKECFDLFPKADCIKVDFGYICPTCAEGGTVSEEDLFKMDFPEYEKMSVGNDMIPEEPMIPVESSEEVPPVEAEEEVDPIPTPEDAVPFLVKDEEEAIAGYEKAAEVVADSDLENKDEILEVIDHIKEEEEEHIEELTDLVDTKEDTESAADDDEIIDVENDPVSDPVETETPLNEDVNPTRYWMLYFDGDDVGVTEAATEDEAMREFEDSFSDTYHFDSTDHDWSVEEITEEEYETYDGESYGVYTYDTTFDRDFDLAVDDMREHVNEEHPAVESEQELSGIDNAEVKCETNPVVSHSKDDLPVDSCDHEMLTEATTDELSEIFRLCNKLGIKTGGDLSKFVREKVKKGDKLLSVLRTCCEGSETSESLTEANVFKQISRIIDPIDKIRMELENNGFGGYLAPQGSEHMFKPIELVDNAGFKYGVIQDLEVDANGVVYIRTSYRQISLDFAGKIVRGTKYNVCRDLVKGIQSAVEVIDKAHRPTRAQQAAQAAADKLDAVSTSLKANPEAVKELFDHVTNIQFKIPLQTDYDVILDDTDPDYEAAVKKLERLYERFMSLPFAQDAIATGVAVNREIRESDKLWQIAQRWYNEAVVTFDCKIGNLTKSKYIIEAAKVDAMSTTGNTVDLDTTNSINCFNLAAALIMYFGKSDFFTDKNTYASMIPVPSTNTNEGIELTDIR